MIKNSSIGRCLKSDFKAFERLSENTFMLRWGMEGVVERVSEYNEETGEHTFTGEVVETDWCNYESGEYKGEFRADVLDKYFEKAQRLPKMVELKAIGEAMEMTEEALLPWMKKHLLSAIQKHDKSKDVEDFTVGGVHMWLNSEMRAKVRENLETAQQKGEENVTLRNEGMAFPMTTVMGWQLYYAVLDYARATWDVTQIHLAEADKLATADEIIAYDYKQGYPAKLAF